MARGKVMARRHFAAKALLVAPTSTVHGPRPYTVLGSDHGERVPAGTRRQGEQTMSSILLRTVAPRPLGATGGDATSPTPLDDQLTRNPGEANLAVARARRDSPPGRTNDVVDPSENRRAAPPGRNRRRRYPSLPSRCRRPAQPRRGDPRGRRGPLEGAGRLAPLLGCAAILRAHAPDLG